MGYIPPAPAISMSSMSASITGCNEAYVPSVFEQVFTAFRQDQYKEELRWKQKIARRKQHLLKIQEIKTKRTLWWYKILNWFK